MARLAPLSNNQVEATYHPSRGGPKDGVVFLGKGIISDFSRTHPRGSLKKPTRYFGAVEMVS